MKSHPMRRLNIVCFAVVMVLSLTVLPYASRAQEAAEQLEPLTPAPSAENGVMRDESASLWFVQLASPPAIEGTSLLTLENEKNAFRSDARRSGLKYTERYAFNKLWNGLSIRIEQGELARLARIPRVSALYPVETLSLPEVQTVSDPDLATALAMTGADTAQSELGYTGEGVRVAIMDTGVDYHHPDLGGCFGSGCRVVTGWDFVGDDFNADSTSTSYNPVAVPDADPDDCQGHGTHVAGIVGASGSTTGVAPGVTFGAYRVFGCNGSTTADIMIAAMEQALADEMQILNMSIGSAFQWPQYPTAQASDRLVNAGMVVVASIGNSGASGAFSAGAPGLGSKVIGVASFDNSHVELSTFTISPDDRPIGFGVASAAPAPPTSGSYPMARSGSVSSTADACDPLPAGSLAGKVALIRRGSCTFHRKSLNAQNAGAIGVVLYNNVAGRFSATVAGTPAIEIPVVSVSDSDGALIDSRLAAGAVALTWTNTSGTFVNPTGGLISSFSSFGLSPDLVLKPDIGAPGGLIRAAYPLERGGYATLSGTSMSAPHVAGAAALLLQARPNTPAPAVRTILQNSASPRPWWGSPGGSFLDNVHRQGAGMVRIDSAILSTTKVEPSKLSLGESEAGPAVRTLTIENSGPGEVSYLLSHAPALATGGNTFTPRYFNGPAAVAFSQSSVSVPAGGTATVDVTITANSALPERSQYGGYIVLTPQGDGQVYRVPYAGFKGDYQSISALTAGGNGFPWLASWGASGYTRQSDGATFSMAGGDIPYLRVHLDHQVRRLRVEVRDALTGKSWHRALEHSYMPRSSTSTNVFSLPWDGTTVNGNKIQQVPDGRYVLVISVQKALGEDDNPAHWESWTSPTFNIARP